MFILLRSGYRNIYLVSNTPVFIVLINELSGSDVDCYRVELFNDYSGMRVVASNGGGLCWRDSEYCRSGSFFLLNGINRHSE